MAIKVFIVDDEETFLKMVKLSLEDTGEFEVKTESNPTKALDLARYNNPDVIILDVIMPEMSGIELAELIKNDGDLQNIPMVFLTAAVSRENAHLQDNMLEGIPVLVKPVGAEELMAKIKEILGGGESASAAG